MSIAKVIEVIGSSGDSFEDAIQQAIKKAGESIRGINGVDVIGQKAVVENDKIVQYRVVLKVAFTLE